MREVGRAFLSGLRMVVRAARCLGRRIQLTTRRISSKGMVRGVTRGLMRPVVLVPLAAGSATNASAYTAPIGPFMALEELLGEGKDEGEPR